MTLHYDGFDQFSGYTSLSQALREAGYLSSGDPVAGTGRHGSYGMSFDGSGFLTRTHPWATGTFSVGVAAQFATRGIILWIDHGEERLLLWVNPEDGNPYVNGHVGGSIPVKGRFYYYELELDRGGTGQLYVNGRPDGQFTIPPQMVSATELTVGIGVPAKSTNGYPDVQVEQSPIYYDDLYINDGPHLGPITVTTRFPSRLGENQWAKSSDQPAWQIVSMRPPGFNDAYVVSDTVGNVDEYYSNKKLHNTQPVIRTGMILIARKSPGFNGRLRGFIGGDEHAGYRDAVIDVDNTWRTNYIQFGPGSDSAEGIEAAKFGIEVAAP